MLLRLLLPSLGHQIHREARLDAVSILECLDRILIANDGPGKETGGLKFVAFFGGPNRAHRSGILSGRFVIAPGCADFG